MGVDINQDILQYIFGMLGTLLAMTATITDGRKKYLIISEISRVCFAVDMILLKAYAGAFNLAILIILTIIVTKYEGKKLPVWLTGVFGIVIIIGNIITYNGILSLLPAIAISIYLFILICENKKIDKIATIISKLLWVIYYLFTLNIVALLYALIAIIDTYKFNIKKETKNESTYGYSEDWLKHTNNYAHKKEQMKISFDIAIIIVVLILGVFSIIGVGTFIKLTEKSEDENTTEKIQTKSTVNDKIDDKFVNEVDDKFTVDDLSKYKNSKFPVTDNVQMDKSGEYYVIKGDYAGEYDLQFLKFSADSGKEAYKRLNNQRTSKKILNYEEYKEFCDEWKIDKKYSNEFQNYATVVYINDSNSVKARLAAVGYNDNDVNLFVWEDIGSYRTEDWVGYIIVVPIDKKVDNIHTKVVFSNSDVDMLKSLEKRPSIDKPVIYLYPTEETAINIELKNKDKITCSYPKYKERWNVIANPNGDLIDTETGRNLYSLYYESEVVKDYKVEDEGFVIKGEDSAKFLEEKLAILGLKEREAEEFIIYWLPKLEANKYNYIRFATAEEIENNMPLEITPKPNTTIRIIMTFKGLENPIQVKEQKLEQVERNGFVAVEWGGSEIK